MDEQTQEQLKAILATMGSAHKELAKLRLPLLQELVEISKDPAFERLSKCLAVLSPMLIDNPTKGALVSYIDALSYLPQHAKNALDETQAMIGTE